MSEKQRPHGDPETPYERMLEHAGLDCSHLGCWQPIVAYVLNQWRVEIGLCRDHLGGHEVTRWLES